MEGTYNLDPITGRVIRIELIACTGSDELFLTAVEKVLREGKRGERLEATYRAVNGELRRLAWLPTRKKEDR